jgi:hypothetical protein
MIYTDFRQAFGHIYIEIQVKIITLVRLAMTSTESQMRLQTEFTDSITTEQRLKYGDIYRLPYYMI